MEQDIAHDWDDTPEDEKKALDAISSHHHLVYHMFNPNFHQNLAIIKEHCPVSEYHENQILSTATAQESNDRILKFLEDKYSISLDYDEFFVILRKLIEMPQAMPIIDNFQKKINECFKERREKEKLQKREKEKLQSKNGTTPTTTSSTVSSIERETPPSVQNGLRGQHHQPSAPPAEAESSDGGTGAQEMSAKSTVSSIVTEVLHSTPGYHILESYKERVCESLPVDYNSTALRLQSLIGASDHMIEWILIGEPSKANHRIYQVVLVFVCFEPHFIKFCDIMEVLAAGSMTAGYILELRKDLIKHLYSNGHITAEEASKLTSKKLFEVPAPPTTTAPPIGPSSNMAVTRASAIDKIIAVFNVLRNLTTDNSTASTIGPSVSSASPPGLASLPQQSNSQLGVTVTDTQPSITVTPNTPVATSLTVFPSRMPKQNGPADSVTTASTVEKVVTSGDTAQLDNLVIGDDGSQAASSAMSDASSNEDQSYYDDLVYDQTTDPSHENTTNGSTTTVTKIPDQRLTAATTATSASSSRGPSPVAALKLGTATPSNKDVKSVTVVLTQAGASSQSGIDQAIDSIVDHNVLSLNGIAQFLLSSSNERSVILMEAFSRVKKSSEMSSRVQEFGDPEDTTEMQKSSGLELLQAKYAEILACFPENYGSTIECLQSYLGDSDIAQIVSLPSGHNQKILDCLIQKVKREEDLLDFCEVLDKISEAPPLLKLIVEQIRKEVIERLQTMTSPVKSGPVLGNLQMPSIPVGPVPVIPPSKIIPEIIDPFESCPLPRDSEGLTILKQSYPSLLKSLSSNHTTTLTRLQNVATVPEDKVESIMTAPNSDVGNEMILSYLIGLILTDNDIIGFCNMVEKMIGGDPEKCESVANLRIAVSSVLQHKEETTSSTKEEGTKKPASPSTDVDVPSPIKTVDTDDTTLPSDDDLKKPQKESEHGDVSLVADKFDKLSSAGGGTVVSEKDVKEDGGVTSQVTKTETVTSSEEALPGPKLNVGTQAALKAFNAYRPQLRVLDAVEVGKQLTRYRLISRKGGTQSGEAIHLPNEIKMDLILPEVEQNISLNGPEALFMLATALSELPSCIELSTQLKDAYQGYRYSAGALMNPQSSPRTQQHVGIHSVAPQNVLPYTNQPQHTAVTGVPVHPQKTEGDSHKVTATVPNTATSTPVPSTAADSTKKQGPALVKCTEETAAVLATFDEYSSLLQESINPFVFIPKCVSYGILRGDVTASVGGGAIFLTNQKKMEIVIYELRNIVFERGIEVFKKILYVLRTEPIYVEVADHIESVYEIYKDPVARQKHKQKLVEAKKAPASEMDPIDTEAALAAFDEYADLTHQFVEVTMFTSKCVGYGVIPETSPITGASIFLPDSLKMDIVLPLIRNNIALNGKSIFYLMTRVLESMGDYRQLAKGFEKIFEEKRQALIAQQSQQVTTEATTVATTSGAGPNINEVAVTSTPVINQLNVQKPQVATTVTTATTTTSTTNTTEGMYKQFSLNIQRLPFITPVTTVPGETTEERLKRLKAKVAAKKAAEAAAEAAAQQQHHSSVVSVQQSTNATGISVQDNPKPQPNIDHLVEKGLQPPSLPLNHICRPKLLDELVQKMLSNKPDPSSLSVAAVITGASGFGKTTLAKALCHDPQIIKSFQDGFIFIELGLKATNPVSNLNKLYSHLTSKQLEQDNLESVVMELRHTTGAYFHNLLVILDDVCEADDAIPYVKAFSNCSVVLTTQLDNISQVISARVELTVSEMEMDEAIALISEAGIKKNDVSVMVSGLAEDLHRWPLLLCLASRQVNHFQKQQQTSEGGAISLTKTRLQEKNLTTLNQSSDKDKHRKTAVQACVELSLEMIGDSLTEKLMIYVLFTGIGCSLSTTVVHMLWQTTESDAERVVKTLLSYGLVHMKTSCGKDTSVTIHTVIAQYLLDSMNASKILQLGSYQGPNVMSIDAAVDKTCGITLPSDDLECLKVILNIIDYGELPCRLRKLSSVVLQSPTSLTSIVQEFDEQVFGLPEHEEIKNKFQNTLNALVDECSEILAITVQLAVTLNTDVYKLIQANSHDKLLKNIELLCRNDLIGEIASKFLKVLTEFMSMEFEDDLCDKGQKAFEQVRTLEQYNDSVVMEFAQIKVVVDLRKRITGALASGVDAQVNEACQYVKSGVLAEKLAKTKENHQSKLKET